jgi:hypothetical protein
VPKSQQPKKGVLLPFRVTEEVHEGLMAAAKATKAGIPELLREAADAIVRAHARSRDGRVPKDMEIRPRFYPDAEEVDWTLAEAPPGETLNEVMAQSPREAAAYFAGRLKGEIITHPHFVHLRSRAAFLECLRHALALQAAQETATQQSRKMARDAGAQSKPAAHK